VGNSERLRLGDDHGARALGPAQPLLAGDGVVVEAGRVDRHGTDGLSTVDEDRQRGSRSQLVNREHGTRRPEDVREGDQARSLRDGREDAIGLGVDDDDPGS
jgi:hypothetical protein